MCLRSESIYRILAPYIDSLLEALFKEDVDLREASVESFSEIICLKTELTVREMTLEINKKMHNGELNSLRQLIRENPEAAQKAARYAAKKLKHRLRRIIEEELNQSVASQKEKSRGERYEF